MRTTFLTTLLLTLLSSFGICQTVAPGTPLNAEQIIQRTIKLGVSEGFDQKILGEMNDSAAVIITKILAGNKLGSHEIDSALVVLAESYAGPSSVISDREPKTTSLLLRYFDLSTDDPALKKRIADIQNRIEKKYARFPQESSR